jgi:hypothetical protein
MRLDTWTWEITEVTEKSRMDYGADGIREFPPFPTDTHPSKISTLESCTVLMIMTCDKVYCARQVKTSVDTFCLLLQVGNVKAQDVHKNLCQTGPSVCETTRRHVSIFTDLIILF